MSGEQQSRQKFKWTKELVNIALNDGMTQEELARVCRTQQSVVSSWKNGKNKATEQQLAELLRRYGPKLNRTTARVYLVCEEPKGTWQESELGRQLLELQERRNDLAAEIAAQRKKEKARQEPGNDEEAQQPVCGISPGSPVHAVPVPVGAFSNEHLASPVEEANNQIANALADLQRQVDPYSAEPWRLEELLNFYPQDFQYRGLQRLVQVEGPILFRYTFFQPVKRVRSKCTEIGREPVGRWLLHDLQRGRLLLVAQFRRELIGCGQRRWEQEIMRLDRYSSISDVSRWVDCPDDAGRWLAVLRGPTTVDELLSFVDDFIENPDSLHSPHDELVLPYLIRKALVEHGHPVPGIDRIPNLE